MSDSTPVYMHFFNFNDSVSNGATWQPTVSVESGTPVYAASSNGKAFELESAVLDLGTDPLLLTQAATSSSTLNIELKVESDATDGVIFACDDISSSGFPVFALSLVDTSGTPKLRFTTWSSADTQAGVTKDINVPSGNGYNNYAFYFTSSVFVAVNGGSWSSGSNRNSAQWGESSGGPFTFEYRIGKSLYGTNPISNGLSTGNSATGVYIDWFVSSLNKEGYADVGDVKDDQNARTYPTETSNALVPPDAGVIYADNSNVSTNAAIPPIVGPVSGGEVQKEFWS